MIARLSSEIISNTDSKQSFFFLKKKTLQGWAKFHVFEGMK
jgi:hypothetical protein